MKIAFIGYGNIGNALIGGILSSFRLSQDICIFHNQDHIKKKLEKCEFIKSGDKCKDFFDIIFLCIKPKDIESAINDNKKIFLDKQIIVSVVAGVSIASIKKYIDKDISVIRAMPNLCAIFGESITGICTENFIDIEKKEYVKNIFKSIGHVREINENEMHLFTAIFGSGPAYIMYFIESLMNSENFDSITKEDKQQLLLYLLNSTSKILLNSEDIKELRSRVSSKGGTTEEALKVFEEKNFLEIIRLAIDAAKKKSFKLSQ